MKTTARRIIQVILTIIYLGLLAYFVYLSLQDGTQSAETSNAVGNTVADVVDKVSETPIVRNEDYFSMIRKVFGHYLYFVGIGTISFMLYTSFVKMKPAVRLVIHFFTGALFALFTEFVLQYITQGRSPSLYDALIDFGGFCTLSVIFTIIFIIVMAHHKKEVDDFRDHFYLPGDEKEAVDVNILIRDL